MFALCASIPLLRTAQSAVFIWLRVLSLSDLHTACIKLFINNNNSSLTREEVTMSNENANEGKVSCWGKIIPWLKIKYSDIKEKVCYCVERGFRWFIRVFSIRFNIDYYNRYTIDEILHKENVEEELKKELQRIRYVYNKWDCFASNFVIPFFLAFITMLVGNFLPKEFKNNCSGIYLVGILFVLAVFLYGFFVCKKFSSYEKMKIVKDELKKIK